MEEKEPRKDGREATGRSRGVARTDERGRQIPSSVENSANKNDRGTVDGATCLGRPIPFFMVDDAAPC